MDVFFSLIRDSLEFRMEESKTQVSLHFLIGAFGSRSLLHPDIYRERFLGWFENVALR